MDQICLRMPPINLQGEHNVKKITWRGRTWESKYFTVFGNILSIGDKNSIGSDLFEVEFDDIEIVQYNLKQSRKIHVLKIQLKNNMKYNNESEIFVSFESQEVFDKWHNGLVYAKYYWLKKSMVPQQMSSIEEGQSSNRFILHLTMYSGSDASISLTPLATYKDVIEQVNKTGGCFCKRCKVMDNARLLVVNTDGKLSQLSKYEKVYNYFKEDCKFYLMEKTRRVLVVFLELGDGKNHFVSFTDDLGTTASKIMKDSHVLSFVPKESRDQLTMYYVNDCEVLPLENPLAGDDKIFECLYDQHGKLLNETGKIVIRTPDVMRNKCAVEKQGRLQAEAGKARVNIKTQDKIQKQIAEAIKKTTPFPSKINDQDILIDSTSVGTNVNFEKGKCKMVEIILSSGQVVLEVAENPDSDDDTGKMDIENEFDDDIDFPGIDINPNAYAELKLNDSDSDSDWSLSGSIDSASGIISSSFKLDNKFSSFKGNTTASTEATKLEEKTDAASVDMVNETNDENQNCNTNSVEKLMELYSEKCLDDVETEKIQIPKASINSLIGLSESPSSAVSGNLPDKSSVFTKSNSISGYFQNCDSNKSVDNNGNETFDEDKKNNNRNDINEENYNKNDTIVSTSNETGNSEDTKIEENYSKDDNIINNHNETGNSEDTKIEENYSKDDNIINNHNETGNSEDAKNNDSNNDTDKRVTNKNDRSINLAVPEQKKSRCKRKACQRCASLDVKPMELRNNMLDYLNRTHNDLYLCLSGIHLRKTNGLWSAADGSEISCNLFDKEWQEAMQIPGRRREKIGNFVCIRAILVHSSTGSKNQWIVREINNNQRQNSQPLQGIRETESSTPIVVTTEGVQESIVNKPILSGLLDDNVESSEGSSLENSFDFQRPNNSSIVQNLNQIKNKVFERAKSAVSDLENLPITNEPVAKIKEKMGTMYESLQETMSILSIDDRLSPTQMNQKILCDEFIAVDQSYIKPLKDVIFLICKQLDDIIQQSNEDEISQNNHQFNDPIQYCNDLVNINIGSFIRRDFCTFLANLLCIGLRSETKKMFSLFSSPTPVTLWALVKDFALGFSLRDFSTIIEKIVLSQFLLDDDQRFRYFICELLNRSTVNEDGGDGDKLISVFFQRFPFATSRLERHYLEGSFWRMSYDSGFKVIHDELIYSLKNFNGRPFQLNIEFEYRNFSHPRRHLTERMLNNRLAMEEDSLVIFE